MSGASAKRVEPSGAAGSPKVLAPLPTCRTSIEHQRHESVELDRFTELVGRDTVCAAMICHHANDSPNTNVSSVASTRPETWRGSIWCRWDASLFGDFSVVREWGRIGTIGRVRVDLFENEHAALGAFEAIERARGSVAIGIWKT